MVRQVFGSLLDVNGYLRNGILNVLEFQFFKYKESSCFDLFLELLIIQLIMGSGGDATVDHEQV